MKNTSKCRICNSNTAILKKIFRNMPLFIWPCNKNQKNEKRNINIYQCKKCGLLQLNRFKTKTVNQFYEIDSCVNDGNIDNKRRFNFLKKTFGNEFFKNKKIIDIGGGRNTILNNYKSKDKWICDIKFNKKQKLDNIKLIKGDFIKAPLPSNYFNIAFLLHTLEHAENPLGFIKKVHRITSSKSYVIIEVPNNQYFTKKLSHYAFFFQHMSLFTSESLIKIMDVGGFKLIKRASKVENNIIFMCFQKKNNLKKNRLLRKDKINLSLILDRIDKSINRLKEFLDKNKDKQIAFYGAGGSNITLFSHLGYHKKYVSRFFDLDNRKIDKYIPLTSIKVYKTNKIRKFKPDIMIFTSKKIAKIITKKYKIDLVYIV